MCGRCDFLSSALKISNEASEEEIAKLKTTISTLEAALALTESLLRWERERSKDKAATIAETERALIEARKLAPVGREW